MSNEVDSHRHEHITTVAIGASAGGLETLQRWFEHIPKNTGAAYFVIQHLSPDYKSIMDKLLERNTSMPIKIVDRPYLIEPDTIYLLSPSKEMRFEETHIIPVGRDNKVRIHLPINNFFKSLAEYSDIRKVGIIMSGTGSDGSLGIKAIHEAGGLVMVQSPKDSQFDGMPVNAIATGVPSIVAPIEQLAETLVNYLKQPILNKDLATSGFHKTEHLTQLYGLLKEESNIDFSVYKTSTFMRRLHNRMSLSQIDSLSVYLDSLTDPTNGELTRLKQDLFIGVTEFFRDKESFKKLLVDVIEPLVRDKEESEPIRIWSIGCSTGEEAYTLAILFHDTMDKMDKFHPVKIFATDADGTSISKAMQGEYPESIANEMHEAYLSNHFIKEMPGLFRVRKHIRNMVVFAQHDITRDPPFSSTDLVTCRNILIYFKASGQAKVLNSIRFSLTDNSHLFLGKAETPTHSEDAFECVDYSAKIYRKIKGLDSRLLLNKNNTLSFNNNGEKARLSAEARAVGLNPPEKTIFLAAAAELFFDYYLPGILIVDKNREVYHSYGDLTAWMQPYRPGRSSVNIRDIFLLDVSSYMLAAISEAEKEETEIVYDNLTNDVNDDAYAIRVIPFQSVHSVDRSTYFIIAFTKTDDHVVNSNKEHKVIDHTEAASSRMKYLEKEVSVLNERLKMAELRLNSANEQLQTSNEELMASNEELQGTNEELQAVNEELFSLNSEYQQKIKELTLANSDIDNFIKSTGIAAIFLDKSYRIRRYTAPFSLYINILPVDVNRSFLDLKLNFNIIDFEEKLNNCTNNGTVFVEKIMLPDSKIAILKMMPYMNSSSTYDGIVMMIDEVEELNKAAMNLQEVVAEDLQRTRLSPAMTWIYDTSTKNFRFSNNKSNYKLDLPDSIGLDTLMDIIPGRFRAQFQELTQLAIDGDNPFELAHPVVVTESGGAIKERKMLSRVSPHSAREGSAKKLLGNMQDISEINLLNLNTKAMQANFDILIREIPIPVCMVDSSQKYTYINPAFEQAFGYSTEEIKKLTIFDLTHPDDHALTNDLYENKLPRAKDDRILYRKRVIAKSGEIIITDISGFFFKPDPDREERVGITLLIPLKENSSIA